MITAASELAINGGPKTRTKPWPGRAMLGYEEKQAVDALFDEAIATGNAIGYNGPQEEAYSREFADFLGGGYADAVCSGTAAIYIALRSLDLEPFTEVIASPITDPGGMMPIPLLNCIPVVADAAPGSFNTGPEQIEEMISPLTSAILVAHIGGEPADIEGIIAVARRHSIPVVEDCAQSHGTRLNGRLVGSFGDVAAFSTMFSKHYCTGGQGGMVYTKHEELYKKIRRLSDRGKPFGLPEGATNCLTTLNFNMDEISAAIGRVQLKKLPATVARRREIAAKIGRGLQSAKAVSCPESAAGAESSYWFMRLRFNSEATTCDKTAFCEALLAEGLPIDTAYNHMPHTFDWYKNRTVFGSSGYPWASPLYKGDPNREFHCPNAVRAIREHFVLYMHEGWGDQEISDALAILAKVERAFLR